MYIYESHMGDLYATEEAQDWDELYCELCGDSDWEIGRADTIEDAWAMLKNATEGCGVCDTCPHAENDNDTFCNNCEKENAGFGTWSLPYIMDFLYENFECKNPSFVYLIARQGNAIFVNYQKNREGAYHSFPFSFCIDSELKNAVAKQLEAGVEHYLYWDNQTFMENDCPKFEMNFVGQIQNDNEDIFLFIMDIDRQRDINVGSSRHDGENWVGFIAEEGLQLCGRDKVVWEYLKQGELGKQRGEKK